VGLFSKVKDAQQQAQQAMQNAGGTQGMTGAMGGDMSAQMEYAQRAQKLHQQGIDAQAVVETIRPTGQTEIGGSQLVDFDLAISPAGGQPYRTSISQSMLPAQLEGLSQGATVGIKYDPDDPMKALIYSW
jgi:hypothetical protein